MNLANRLTVLRILLVPVFIALLLYFSPERAFLHLWAVGVYLLACLTDAVDGYLARRLGQTTTLGSYIDPIADKLLLLSGYCSLSLMPNIPAAMHVPAWVTLAVISRDVVILVGAVTVFIATGSLKPQPLWVSKVTTVVQMTALLFSLLALPWSVRLSLYALTVCLTLVSGIAYIRLGARLFQEKI